MSLSRNISDFKAAIASAVSGVNYAMDEWNHHLLCDIEELIKENDDLRHKVDELERWKREAGG